MSADVRALLKAKTKERENKPKIEHPYAAYNASGQLRCNLCATVIKYDHGTAWDGHLSSKTHRTNVARLKELERAEEEKKRLEKGKRKAMENDDEEEDQAMSDGDGDVEHVSKRAKTAEPEPKSSGGFPSDFFSDPNRTVPTAQDDETEENKAADGQKASNSQLDDEWAQFERDVLSQPATAERRNDVFERATVFAEPQLSNATPDGFPAHLTHPPGPADPEVLVAEADKEETEDQKRKRKETEEKELIMDRLIEEERAQEDADERVRSLKARLAAAKQKRAELQAAKRKP